MSRGASPDDAIPAESAHRRDPSGRRPSSHRAGRQRAHPRVPRRHRGPHGWLDGGPRDDPGPRGRRTHPARHLSRLPHALPRPIRQQRRRDVRRGARAQGRSAGAVAPRAARQRRPRVLRERERVPRSRRLHLHARLSHGAPARLLRGPRRAVLERHRQRPGVPDRPGIGDDHAAARHRHGRGPDHRLHGPAGLHRAGLRGVRRRRSHGPGARDARPGCSRGIDRGGRLAEGLRDGADPRRAARVPCRGQSILHRRAGGPARGPRLLPRGVGARRT